MRILETEVFIYSELSDSAKAKLRDFAAWIYKQLEEAYDYENSDENIADMFENSASDFEFTEDGEPCSH